MSTAAHAQEPWILDKYSVPVTPLKGRAIGDPEVLATPSTVLLHGSRLIVLDNGADEKVILLDSETGKTIGSFGRKGRGPGEFLGLVSGDPDQTSKNAFSVYDLTLRRMTRIDLGPNFPATGWPKFTTRVLKATMTEPRTMPSGEVFGPGILQSGRIAVINTSGDIVRTFGELPTIAQEVPITVRQEAYRSYMALSPDRKRIVLATRYADRLDYFDSQGKSIGSAARPFGFEPKFSVRQGALGPVMATGDALRYGYVALGATDGLVYALFSGRTRAGFQGQANFGNFLHVYDWNGRLIRVFRLDTSVAGLAVDPDGSRFFTLRHDPVPSVVVYTLPRM